MFIGSNWEFRGWNHWNFWFPSDQKELNICQKVSNEPRGDLINTSYIMFCWTSWHVLRLVFFSPTENPRPFLDHRWWCLVPSTQSTLKTCQDNDWISQSKAQKRIRLPWAAAMKSVCAWMRCRAICIFQWCFTSTILWWCLDLILWWFQWMETFEMMVSCVDLDRACPQKSTGCR